MSCKRLRNIWSTFVNTAVSVCDTIFKRNMIKGALNSMVQCVIYLNVIYGVRFKKQSCYAALDYVLNYCLITYQLPNIASNIT